MLKSISWEQFLITLACIAAMYYAVVTLIFYRKELARFVKTGPPFLRADVNKVRTNTEKADNTSSTSPMGPAVREARIKQLHTAQESSAEMLYAAADDLPDPIDDVKSDTDQECEAFVETISDLLEEIKAICGAITDSVATKEEATTLFKELLARFQSLKGTPYHSSINDHIYSATREPFIVAFSREEIEAFWDDHQ